MKFFQGQKAAFFLERNRSNMRRFSVVQFFFTDKIRRVMALISGGISTTQNSVITPNEEERDVVVVLCFPINTIMPEML